MYYYCKKEVLVVHGSDVRCIITVRKDLVVHESDVRCIITVRKECWWYMNQMSDVLLL